MMTHNCIIATQLQPDCNFDAIGEPVYIEDEHPYSGLLEED